MREPTDWTLPSGVDSSHLYFAESEGSESLMTSEALLSQKSISYLRPRYTSLFSLNQWTSKSFMPGLIAQSNVADSGEETTTSLTLLKMRGGSPTVTEDMFAAWISVLQQFLLWQKDQRLFVQMRLRDDLLKN